MTRTQRIALISHSIVLAIAVVGVRGNLWAMWITVALSWLHLLGALEAMTGIKKFPLHVFPSAVSGGFYIAIFGLMAIASWWWMFGIWVIVCFIDLGLRKYFDLRNTGA